MIKNYFLIAWRNILKRRFYSLLNIVGLGIGILFTLLIAAYVWNEWQVNRHLRHASAQYFLTSKWKDPNMGVDITTLGPLSRRLKEDYPNLVANYYRWDGITSVVSRGDKHLRENIQVGDSTFLSMYGFRLLHGDGATALNEPYSVVITQDIAIKYFGREDVVGETLNIQSFSGTKHDFSIKGVLEDIPENSVLQLNAANHNTFFIPFNTISFFGRQDPESWGNTILPSYVELQPGVKPADLEKPIAQLIKSNAAPDIVRNLAVVPVPLEKYYLQKNNALVKRMLYALSFVGLFILLMAIVNFVNISISSSSSRIKEMGVRKVLGGLRKQIIVQLLTESVILASIATLIALIAYPFSRPFFAGLVGKEIPILSSFPVYFIAIPIIGMFVIGLLAGFYPAFVLSSLRSADAIKGKMKTIRDKVWLRKSLAGFQFCIAALVMIAAFIVSKQVSYFFSRGLGYNKDYIVSSQVPRDWTAAGVQHMETVRDEFARMPEVKDVTLSYEIPNGMNGGQPPIYREGTDSTLAVSAQMLATDEHYLDTYGIPMKAGQYFQKEGSFDSSKVILNETAALAIGFANAQEAINGHIRVPGIPIIFTVTGVTDDFHFGSMQQKIPPMIFLHPRFVLNYRYLSFKLKPGHPGEAIAAIDRKWAQLLPGSSFEYQFMDDTLSKLYQTELQLKKASYTATVLSMVIAMLGVLGLVSLSVQKRIKEIGIRKVLGASLPSIVNLFLREFLVVILVGGLIACPLAWIVMRGWLNDYAYRIPLTATPFLLSIAGLIGITVILVIGQTIKAGAANPVRSLRSE